jgi:hypothetical protein
VERPKRSFVGAGSLLAGRQAMPALRKEKENNTDVGNRSACSSFKKSSKDSIQDDSPLKQITNNR